MSKLVTICMVSVFFFLSVCTQAIALEPAELIAIRDAADEALNTHDLDQWLSYCTDDFVFDFTALPAPLNTREEIIAFFEDLFEGFPNFGTTEARVLAAENIVVAEHSTTGTHLGVWQGIPPTSNTSLMPHLDIYEFEGDKIKRGTTYGDMAGVMMQLGVMPATREDYTWGASSEVTGEPGDEMTNTALVLYLVEKFWNQQNVNALDDTHSPDFIAHIPVIPGHPLPFYVYKQVCLMHLAAFPDLRITTDENCRRR